MARKPPGAVRASLPVRPRTDRKFSTIPGLPRWALADIHRAEATLLRPGDVGAALRELREYARVAHRYQARWTLRCLCCEPMTRDTLDSALLALPPRSRAALRALIRPLDALILQKTLPDPTAPPGWPWWERRIDGLYRC